MPDSSSWGAVSEVVDVLCQINSVLGCVEQEKFDTHAMGDEGDASKGALLDFGKEGCDALMNIVLGFPGAVLSKSTYIADG